MEKLQKSSDSIMLKSFVLKLHWLWHGMIWWMMDSGHVCIAAHDMWTCVHVLLLVYNFNCTRKHVLIMILMMKTKCNIFEGTGLLYTKMVELLYTVMVGLVRYKGCGPDMNVCCANNKYQTIVSPVCQLTIASSSSSVLCNVQGVLAFSTQGVSMKSVLLLKYSK